MLVFMVAEHRELRINTTVEVTEDRGRALLAEGFARLHTGDRGPTYATPAPLKSKKTKGRLKKQ